VRKLGLDLWPELRDTYFAHYTRVVWLAQRPTSRPRADTLGRPLEVIPVGKAGLERGLEALLDA
jgi:hypothetical protein